MHLLMVTYDFPPSNRVAVQRSLAFAYHLLQLGWDITILTVKAKCYGPLNSNLFIPDQLENSVYRTFAYDSMKIGWKGKYIDFLTLPDEWISWYPFAVSAGKKIIKKEKIDIVFSTCPPFTPHLIAGRLAGIADIPWVADYRDPVVPGRHGVGVLGQQWAIEKTDSFTVKNAAAVLFTTEESKSLYEKTYDKDLAKKFFVVSNGYYDLPDINRDNIASVEAEKKTRKVLLYSGSIYGARDPSLIFHALKELLDEEKLSANKLVLVFQGEALEAQIGELSDKYGLRDSVKVLPAVGFEDSLRNIYQADALLLIQGERFNLHIPAKAYEYIAARRRIVALCPEEGATAKLLASVPGSEVVNSLEQVKSALIKVALAGGEPIDRQTGVFARKTPATKLSDIMREKIETFR